ncbi:biotin/lipoyl-containing protein, partial [Streptomyces sp. NPDC051211]|uniref:biotin/lipoyl-containing protein n=1 Tax=Streptomyces sp. NPDC051211 TaxID=3154643 RepID=UPI00344BBD5A
MPDVGEGLTEAEILKWYVQPGDTVTDGQVVCEVETAKAAVELPIPFDGVVHELRFPEGTTVDVGQVAITVDVGGAPAAGPEERRQPVLVGYGVAPSSSRRRPRMQTTAAPASAPVAGRAREPQSRPLAKPPVRKLAKDLGVDLSAVFPTGPDGTVTREDVRKAAAPAAIPQQSPAQVPVPAAVPAAIPVGAGVRETRIPVKGVRKVTAQAMVGSAFTAPHVTEFITFDITKTMNLV